jgi:hypothetical protein
MADAAFDQVQKLQKKIDANNVKIQALTETIEDLIKRRVDRKKILPLLTKRTQLSQQNVSFDNQIFPLLQVDVKVMGLKTSKLQKDLSDDPVANPYFYSRKEKDPKYAEIAKKRTSMRMRGKNPGPWTSDLMSQELRSLEMEDGADPTLAAVAKQMGQKKSKKKKSKKPKRSSRSKSRRR